MVVPIGDEKIPRIIEMETRGCTQLCWTIPRARTPDDTSIMIRGRSDDATISFFKDEQRTVRVEEDPNWRLKNQVVRDAIAGDRSPARLTHGETLNAIVPRVSNEQISIRIDEDATWKAKLPCERTRCASTSDGRGDQSRISKRSVDNGMVTGHRAVQRVIRTEKEAETTPKNHHHIDCIQGPPFQSATRDTVVHEDLSCR